MITSEARSKGDAIVEVVARYPRVRTLWSRGEPSFPAREYFLFRGSIEAVSNFHFGVWWQPPNLWWPNDRAWCVASEVDGYDTFVGGTAACIQGILHDGELEAFAVRPEDPFEPQDALNPTPWDRDP